MKIQEAGRCLKMLKDKKAQIFTTDFFIAFFIFSILIIVAMVSWNNYYIKITEINDYDIMMNKAFQISDVLVKSQGYPLEWDSENVQIIGLASEDRELSLDKVNLFANLPLNKSKNIFKTQDSKFHFSIKNFDGEILKEYGYNMTNAKKSVNVRRYLLYNDEEAVMEFTLWK